MFAVRRTKFFFMALVIVLNRLLGEVGVGVRDFEALPLNFPFPVCLHFLTPFPCVYLHLVVLLISSQTTMEHEVACLDITPTCKKSNYYI